MSEGISVVVAVYNGKKYLAQQLDSIFRQLQAEDELVIIDDCSTDEAVAGYRFPSTCEVRVYRNDRNLGVKHSFQRGLSLARRELIFLSDQDDIWLPYKRDAFIREFARSDSVQVVLSDAEIIDAEGKLVDTSFMARRGGFGGGVLATLWKNRYLGCAMAIRRELLGVALPFPRCIPMHDMWIGVMGSAVGMVAYLPTPYLQYRRHSTNLTPQKSQRSWIRLLAWRAGLLAAVMGRLMTQRHRRHRD
jgi:glycosyltransferase involved in cell wall biosynthesis